MRAVKWCDSPFGHDGWMAHAISTEAYCRVLRLVYMPCETSECSCRVGSWCTKKLRGHHAAAALVP